MHLKTSQHTCSSVVAHRLGNPAIGLSLKLVDSIPAKLGCSIDLLRSLVMCIFKLQNCIDDIFFMEFVVNVVNDTMEY